MAVAHTRALMGHAIELQAEVPALRRLWLVLRVELRARRGDAPIGRVERPGPRIERDRAGDARVRDERGHLRVGGDAAVTKLLDNVIERQVARG